MNITQERIDDLNAVIKVHMTPDDYQEKVKEELRKHARKASMPGFRPGKVPMSLIKKMVGPSVVIETVNKALQENLQSFIEEEKLELLGDPLPTVKHDESYFDLECTKDLDFDFEVGLAPKFELNLNLPEPVTRYKIEADEEFVDQEVEQLRDRYADFINPEEVEKGDIVFGKLSIANEAGEPLEEGFEKMVALNPSRIDSENIFVPFFGKKVDDTAPFSLDDLSGDDEDRKKLLMIDDEDLEEIKGKPLVFTIKRISRIIMAELNEELFKKAFGEDTEIKDVEGMKAELRKSLEGRLEQQARNDYRSRVRKALENNHSMEFPSEFLKKWMQESYEKVTDENIEQEYSEMTESLKWSLIVEKIRKSYPEIDIQPDELEGTIKDSLRKSMGDTALSDEDLDQYTKYIMSNEEMLKQHYYRILDDKLFHVLEEKIQVAEKKISSSDFEKLED